MSSGCGCKEVAIDFLILLISFLQQHPFFLFIFNNSDGIISNANIYSNSNITVIGVKTIQ